LRNPRKYLIETSTVLFIGVSVQGWVSSEILFVRLTLYSWKAAIAGSCHGMTSSTASVLHPSAAIVLGGRTAVNAFQ
jgi:hypothetical protein